jgi:SAM-dependent methyltransferase
VWTQKEFLELLQYCQSKLGFPFEIELFQKNEIELVVVLSKQHKEFRGGLDLQSEFKMREPWITKFVIAGEEYGGDFNAMQDPRVDQFFDFFPAPTRILELGSLEGGHTFSLASRPSVEYVLGVEGRQTNVDKAKFLQQLLGVKNVEFVTANLEEIDLSLFGNFDVVFCSGLLYHLPEPWRLIEQIARVSPNLFIWTHYVKDDAVNTTANGYRGITYKEHGLAELLSGMSAYSFWPTLTGLQQMLKEYGFKTVDLIEDQPDHPHGPAITLAATSL